MSISYYKDDYLLLSYKTNPLSVQKSAQSGKSYHKVKLPSVGVFLLPSCWLVEPIRSLRTVRVG